MNDSVDRVNIEEMRHDAECGVAEALAEFELAGKVDEIMGGDDPEVVMDLIIDDDEACSAMMGIASMDCSKPFSLISNTTVQRLAYHAHKLNRRIEFLLADDLGSQE